MYVRLLQDVAIGKIPIMMFWSIETVARCPVGKGLYILYYRYRLEFPTARERPNVRVVPIQLSLLQSQTSIINERRLSTQKS